MEKQMVYYNIEDLDLNIEEFNVYIGDKEIVSEKESYKEKLDALKNRINNSTLSNIMTNEMFPKGIPISPFPTI